MTTTKLETKRMQLWPGGRSLEIEQSGDEVKRVREYDYNTRKGGRKRFRKPTAEELRQIRIEQLAEGYQEREIWAMDSCLVDDALKNAFDSNSEFANEWTLENVKNYWPTPTDWDLEKCKDWLQDHGYDPPDLDDTHSDEELLESWREAVSDKANDHPAEIYQWFRVSDWFAHQLDIIGEPVLENAYGTWWGRTCCGQNLIMDGTLQEIAARHVD